MPTIKSLVDAVVRAYRRKLVSADPDDMRQSGYAAAFDAVRRYDKTRNVNRSAYVRRAIVFGLRHDLWRDSAPVSGGMHRPREQRAHLTAAPYVENPDATDRAISDADVARCLGAVAEISESGFDPEQAVSEAEWRRLVRRRLAARYSPAVVAVLLGEQSNADAAARCGVSVASIYRRTARAREQIAGDAYLWRLLSERKRW